MGSRFIFTARFELQNQSRNDSFHTPEKLEGTRALVVDDSATSRQIMKYYLEGFSFLVNTANSGEEALTMLEKADKPYQLVLMDWQMPGLNGIETTRRIKNMPDQDHIPTIIMVTAYDKDAVMQQAQDVGLDGVLIKPVGQSTLFDTVMSTFGYKVRYPRLTNDTSIPNELPLSSIAGARILVVEDNAINQQIAREVLQQAGLVVVVVNNGEEAVQKVNEESFDVVLMDLQMPVMDGYEATRLIREDSRFDTLAIIAMTAHAMVEEKQKCLAIGMNGHISKPIDLNQLFTELRKWISEDSGRRAEAGKQQMESAGQKATDGDSHLPDVLQGFDLAVCLKNLGGNKTLLKSLLGDFHEELSCTAAQIRALLKQGDRHSAERLAHTIKGTSGNLSATALYAAATRLDQALRAEHSDALPDLLDAFETALNEVMDSIAGLNLELNQELQQKKPSTDADTDIDMQHIRPLFSELSRLIGESSLDADECFQRLKKQLHHSSVHQDMQALETAINNFDFDQAQLVLNNIAAAMDACTNMSHRNTP